MSPGATGAAALAPPCCRAHAAPGPASCSGRPRAPGGHAYTGPALLVRPARRRPSAAPGPRRPVGRRDRLLVALAGPVCLLLEALHGVLLGPVDRRRLLTALGEGGLIAVERGRGQDLTACRHPLLVDGISGPPLPPRRVGVPAQIVTERRIAALGLPQPLVATAAAVDEAWEPRCPVARDPTPPVVLLGGLVGVQDGRNACQRLPRHSSWVAVVHDHFPRCQRPSTLLGASPPGGICVCVWPYAQGPAYAGCRKRALTAATVGRRQTVSQ